MNWCEKRYFGHQAAHHLPVITVQLTLKQNLIRIKENFKSISLTILR